MLSPLRRQVAQIIAGLEEAEEFALSGGAELIVHGDVSRELGRLSRLRRDGFAIDDVRYAQLGNDVERWRAQALGVARRQGIDRHEDRDIEIDL